ncbi:MAG TPA: TerC family protein [Streptosporangiaceae bacterium]|nr:TerC family protein [Streptosporangiaceae bacterium]
MSFPIWAWAAFILFVLAMLALDLFVLHRDARQASLRQAAAWSAVWVALALGFGAVLFAWRGTATGQAYLTGYLIEKSLSVDNVFVYAVIFTMFGIPARHQHRVLMYGIIGALIMRGAFIAGGAALLNAFHATVYLFGALLIYAAVRLFRHTEGQIDPARNVPLRVLSRLIPTARQLHGQKLLIRIDGRLLATPLLIALLLIETTDVIFAVDSIPAVFAVTRDTFVIFTSNVFALLGMRALYFLLAGAAARLRYLQAGLGVILAGVGVKMLLSDLYEIPAWASLSFIAAVLLATIAASWYAGRRPPAAVSAPAGRPKITAGS